MMEFDHFTKKKAPNAYILFTTHFVDEYKAVHGDSNRRFAGSIARAIKDPLIVEAWSGLQPEERQAWKDRARQEKVRQVNEFSEQLQQYVEMASAARSNVDENQEQRDKTGNAVNNGAVGGQDTSMHLKRMLRPRKPAKRLEQSKYAPSFLEEISTAKHFEEKRRRERDCLKGIWVWRTDDDKEKMSKESFILVSSQSPGVREDLHAPGTIAFLEFTIKDGIKREFSCNVSQGQGIAQCGRMNRTNEGETSCGVPRPSSEICREVFGEWLRSAQRDLSSKTPIFFCLVDEYPETFDCLTYIYNYKDGSSRFAPYLLGTMDDLCWCLLQYFEVPVSLENPEAQQQAASRAPIELFALGRVIDQYIQEFPEFSCQLHQQLSNNAGCNWSSASGDTTSLDKEHRCPIAVVRACVELLKKWITNGRVDEQLFVASTPLEAETAKQLAQEQTPDSAKSVRTEDIDQFSYLALSDDENEPPTNRIVSHDNTVVRCRSTASNVSDSIIEIHSDDEQETPKSATASAHTSNAGSIAQAQHTPMKRNEPLSSHSSYESEILPIQSQRANEISVKSKGLASTSRQGPSSASMRNVYAVGTARLNLGTISTNAQPNPEFNANATPVSAGTTAKSAAKKLTPGNEKSVGRHLWTEEFRVVYESQLRLPHGCRGLGRGIPWNVLNALEP